MKRNQQLISDLYDDITSEMLKPTPECAAYKLRLRQYLRMVYPLKTYFAHSIVKLTGDRSIDVMKATLVTVLCRVIANQPSQSKSRERPSKSLSLPDTENDRSCS
jgi:hypothetical protein